MRLPSLRSGARFWSFTFVALVVLAACEPAALPPAGDRAGSQVSLVSGSPCPRPAPALAGALAPARRLVVGFDLDPAYPPDQALIDRRVIADLAVRLVEPGAGATIYPVLVGPSPAAAVLPRFDIPPVTPRAVPKQFEKPPFKNPVTTPEEDRRYEQALAAYCGWHAETAQLLATELANARQTAQAQAELLRQLRVPPVPGRRFEGFFSYAAGVLGNAPPGTMRILLLYTRLDSPPSTPPPSLEATKVFLSYVPASPTETEARVAAWRRWLDAARPASVDIDPFGVPIEKLLR